MFFARFNAGHQLFHGLGLVAREPEGGDKFELSVFRHDSTS